MRLPAGQRGELVPRHTFLLLLVLLIAGFIGPLSETYAELTITVIAPDRLSTPGASETFLGTITNGTGAPLSSTDLFLDFSGFDAHVTPFQLLGSTDLVINNGTTSAPLELFRLDLGLGTPPGVYFVDVLLQDAGDNVSDPVTVSLRVVPEPATWLLFSLALAALICVRRRHASALLRKSCSIRRQGDQENE